MSFNTSIINTKVFNGGIVSGTVIGTGSGPIVALEQDVQIVGSGSLVGIEQTITLLETGSGSLVSLEQLTNTTASGSLVAIGQNVRSTTESSRLSRRGHDVAVFIGGYQVPDDDLTDEMSIVFNEDAAASCDFTVRPTIGVQDIAFYYGKTVVVNITKTDNSVHRAFTGIVDVVDFDIITNKTQLTCTDRRKELMNTINGPLSLFGQYDTSLLENYNNNSNTQIIDKLLPYRPYSLDFDSQNQWHYTSWTPKATADITLSDPTVFRRDPSIELINRGRVVNKINITATYTFKRLHNHTVGYTFNTPYTQAGTNFSLVVNSGYTLTTRNAIESAISGTGWPLKDPIVYTGLPAPGYYGLGPVTWVGDTIRSNTTAVLAGDNVAVITDSNGNTVYTYNNNQTYDIAGEHCTVAAWNLVNRWSQDITHKYSLSISNTNSAAVFGEVSKDSSYSFSEDYDSSRWDTFEEYDRFFSVGDGSTIDMNSSGTTDVQQNFGLTLSNIQSVVEKARTEILSSHRDNKTIVETNILPEVQLHHTVDVNATKVSAKGKVKTYTHSIDFKEPCKTHTMIEIAFYALGAGGSDSSTTIPAVSDSAVGTVVSAYGLGAVYGEAPDSTTGSYRDAGFHGNKFIQNGISTKIFSTYPTQFIVDSPAIPESLTDGYEFIAADSYNMSIPTGTITITYDGKC